MEIVVGLLVVLVAGACVVFGLMHLRERAEAKRQEFEAGRHFEAAVRRRLGKGLDGFDLAAFAEQSNISPLTARSVGDELYASMARKAFADGKVSPKERATLDKLAAVLAVPPSIQQQVEDQAARGVFRREAERALADGELSTVEAAELDDLRHRLGLTKAAAYDVAKGDVDASYLAQFRTVLHRGRITQADIDELMTMRQTFGISQEHAYELVRRDAEAAYREYFTTVKQDGEVSDVEEKSLDTVQRFLGLPDAFTAPYKEQIRWLRHLSDCRSGRLPSLATRKLLEGGELCHFESRCRFVWQTARGRQSLDGELTITDRRVIFTSAVRSHEFRPAKIADIELHGDGLIVTLTSGRGTGVYLIDRPDEAEAILTAVARKQKYIAVEGFASEQTRHIPRHVRQEVWARDSGKCCECGATDYLEFDHIIPHSKGGANTPINVQLLCRRCNGVKSDRI